MDNVRFVQINEIKECIDILSLFSKCLKSLRESSLDGKRAFAKKFIDYGSVIVAKNEQDESMGFIAYYANDTEKKVAFISMIAVLPQYRNMHLGSDLIDYCISDCEEKGMLSLRLEVAIDNAVGMSFYKKKGFVKENELRSSSLFLLRRLGI